MSVTKELANELESYFLCQHRTYCEAIGREIKRQNRDDLKDVQGNWYKYCVDGKLSAKRYRVTKVKELQVTTANPGAEGTTNNPQGHSEEQPAEPTSFGRIVDAVATKIKNNRGLLGMIAGVGLTYAGQAVHNRYRVTAIRNRERRVGDTVGDNADSNVNNPTGANGQ